VLRQSNHRCAGAHHAPLSQGQSRRAGDADLSSSFLSIRNDAYPDASARQSGLFLENLKPPPSLPGLSPDMEGR
jgi:hypothetical protein